MALIRRLLIVIVFFASFAIAVPVLLSGTLRSAYVSTLDRKIASIWRPKYAFVGDSLTAGCNWRWELGELAVINLGIGGADIKDIARQVVQASALKVAFMSIEGGINDVILEAAPVERIGQDFGYLLERIPADQKAVVTLIPLVSYQSLTAKIEAANSALRSLAEGRGLPIVDLNSRLAPQGVRRPETTTDGIHFTREVCRIWAEEIRDKFASLETPQHEKAVIPPKTDASHP